MENNILVVEDNEQTVKLLENLLKQQGYNIKVVNNKNDVLEYMKSTEISLIILDIQLPESNGFEICKIIKENSDIPVIFLTGKSEEKNIVHGLDIGADDYIIKPFKNNELISRIKNILRRYYKTSPNSKIIHYRKLEINTDKAAVYKNLQKLDLTNLEYKLLLMFIKNKNKLITRAELLEKIWDIDGNYVNDNTLSVYIKRLRLKIGDSKNNKMIETVRGIGYILK